MQQAVMVSPGSIEIRDVAAPVASAGQLLVRIKRIGICGSDIHVWHGKHPFTTYPVVQGHEVSGIVETLGPGVRGFRPGDPVTIQPQVACGACYPCQHGNYHICDQLKVMGFQTTGAASELFVVEAAKVLKLPTGLSLEQGAMVEPVAVGVHALGRAGSVERMNILVLGAGPIGNLVAQAARALGAARVMITDVSDYRLEYARECGIPLCVNVAKEDLGAAIAAQFGPGKADLILECVGSGKTIGQAIETARKGTEIIIVGVVGDRPAVDMAAVQDRELQLTGTLMYQEPDWKKAINLIRRGKILLAPLVTDRFAFSRFAHAYRYIDANRERAMKVMISLDE